MLGLGNFRAKDFRVKGLVGLKILGLPDLGSRDCRVRGYVGFRDIRINGCKVKRCWG